MHMATSLRQTFRATLCNLRSSWRPFHSHRHRYAMTNASAPSTFVSKHFRLDERDIQNYLKRKGLVYRMNENGPVIRDCPVCPRPTHHKVENLWKLYVNKDSGAWICFRCQNTGSWFDLKAKLGDIQEPTPLMNSSASKPAPVLPQDLAVNMMKRLHSGQYPAAQAWLTGKGPTDRHLSRETLETYHVGCGDYRFMDDSGSWVSTPCVSFPMYMVEQVSTQPTSKSKTSTAAVPAAVTTSSSSMSLVRMKLRGVGPEMKHHQRMEPSGGGWGLFGLHTVPADAKEIVITEGEFDAMAVYQATGYPTVSLPNGASSLPVQVLPWLERFDTIYLWMDEDLPGQEGAKKFAHKLGEHRVRIVRTREQDADGPKDANDALRLNRDLTQYLKRAKSIPQQQLLTFADLRSEIQHEIVNSKQAAGVPSATLPSLTKLLKGHRKGELTILTGPTGSGKTTLLSQLSLDYLQQGVPTLWGSFEIKNTRLAKKMLYQFAGKELTAPQEFEFWADKFEALPQMLFMKAFGSTDVDKVLDAMDYAVYAEDVEHILLDNLQFMTSGQGKGIEKFDVYDTAMEKLRHFATSRNVHITLVIHPRKVDDNMDLNISSVFGTAKATQEADNVIILQNKQHLRFLDIKKNRFDGDVGRIVMTLDKKLQKYVELSTDDVNAYESGFKTLEDILEAKRNISKSNMDATVNGSVPVKTATVISSDADRSTGPDNSSEHSVKAPLESEERPAYVPVPPAMRAMNARTPPSVDASQTRTFLNRQQQQQQQPAPAPAAPVAMSAAATAPLNVQYPVSSPPTAPSNPSISMEPVEDLGLHFT
eukprot:GILK01007682.1.p1 GENE.GILK01007682.1~~GILK01007682.1.p1  ORF type:complete len:818 (-),score=127.08 GILK01007682.1:134-2587(-)